MAPVTPHIAEELWERRGQPYSIHQPDWPAYDAAAAAEDLMTIVVQVNGKVRDRLQLPVGTAEAEVKAAALASESVRRNMEGKEPRHTHPAQVHNHEHFHVSHHHRGGPLSEWEHRKSWHTHEHNHAELTHSHDDDREEEDSQHGRLAHTHDHAMPNEPPVHP